MLDASLALCGKKGYDVEEKWNGGMAVNRYWAPEVNDGDFLGDYQVLGVLGRGSCGTCYHVISNHLGKEFALKSIPVTPTLSKEWLDRLEAQTTLLSRMTHPYIDRIVNSGHAGNLWFCLKDFVHNEQGESCNLREYQEKHLGKLSHFQVYHITSQLLQALQYAKEYRDPYHQQGICHGNLKPENILISHVGEGAPGNSHAPFEVKLSDFQPYGLLNQSVILSSLDQWLNRMGNYASHISEKAVGNALTSIYHAYDYFPPEKRRAEETEKPTLYGDVYALGILIYRMFLGIVPCGRFLSPSKIRPELPRYWDTFIQKCLAYTPEQRYGSYEQMRRDLQEKLGEDIQSEVIEKEEETEEQGKKKRRERRSLTPPGMVYVPAGKFFVGSADCGEDALPQHECETQGFYIDRAPVTVGQFLRFVQETNYITEAEKEGRAPVWIDGEWKMMPGCSWKSPLGVPTPEDFELHPVTQVTFRDALAYAGWAERRLPTEEEWEYAARGGLKDVLFPIGNQLTRSHANFSSDFTCAVMRYQANGYGLYDMSGNVWEWTASWYKAYPGNLRPTPHFGEKYRVVRGGAWLYDAAHCKISYRNANAPDQCYPTVGFRTVSDFKLY